MRAASDAAGCPRDRDAGAESAPARAPAGGFAKRAPGIRGAAPPRGESFTARRVARFDPHAPSRAPKKPARAPRPARAWSPKPARAAPRSGKRAAASRPEAAADGRVVVENVSVPGYEATRDATKYAAMRKALLKLVPKAAPGVTQAEMFDGVKARLPEALFPGGAKAEGWAKRVQLDLEAKGVLARDAKAKPLRGRRVA